MKIDRVNITAEGAPGALGPYTHAVRSGDLLFLSGQLPLDPATDKLVEGDLVVQTRRCLKNLALVAEAAGGRIEDAVRCGIYVTDMGQFAAVNEAYSEFFGESRPARSTIGVASLPIAAQVEIDAIVALAPRT